MGIFYTVVRLSLPYALGAAGMAVLTIWPEGYQAFCAGGR